MPRLAGRLRGIMRDKVELFLGENSSESFKAGEIAKHLEMSKGVVKKRLKKLVKQGRVEGRKGRYRTLVTLVVKQKRSSGQRVVAARKGRPSEPKRVPANPETWTARRLVETARSAGISVETLQRWVDEKRRRASDEESKRHIYGVLSDIERSQGKKAGNQGER
jgi:DNA-binding MarR family transcriptional regulator